MDNQKGGREGTGEAMVGVKCLDENRRICLVGVGGAGLVMGDGYIIHHTSCIHVYIYAVHTYRSDGTDGWSVGRISYDKITSFYLTFITVFPDFM
jgi:hypothetical protein